MAIAFSSLPASAQETATYQYDALGRLIATSVSGGPNNGVASSYALDAAGNRTQVVVTGAPASTPTPTPTPTPGGLVANADVATFTTTEVCGGIYYDVRTNDTDSNGHYPLRIISVTSADPFINFDASGILYYTFPRAEPSTVTGTYVVANSINETATASFTFEIVGANRSCD
ncbi:hypothetical protein [Sphingomonas kyeonggiensis]|uniref:YD repeat-containing protein n=1 Tax=Sphingomonas kyeonggiensis TaxID=1268553 RepID=A0A7W6JV99_9SPHN|nr:hypothetical protein [Sphingomonas kyeonggiensis]MBB4100214.1 hypothetical protein [Sphingomonas kyeonggiensis]